MLLAGVIGTVSAGSFLGYSVTAEAAKIIDVDDNDPLAVAIYWAQENGITFLDSQGKFNPGNSCTREQIVTFIWRALGRPQPSSKAVSIKDVPESNVYYKPIKWAKENGITFLYPDGGFHPFDKCTREQIVTFIWRIAGRPEPKNTAVRINDVPTDNVYYKAIKWAQENGITYLDKKGNFNPFNRCSRREAVTFVYRYVKKIMNKGWKTVTEGGKTKKYYYGSDGKPVKGLQKIDNKWYLFDKSTGEYLNESGDELYMGTYFGSDNGYEDVDKYDSYKTKSYKFVTLDGLHLHAITNADYSYNSIYPTEEKAWTRKTIFENSGRDSSVLFRNGLFFTAMTGRGQGDNVRDFSILKTNDFLTYDWCYPNTHYEYSEKKKSNGKYYERGSPEWFYDESTKRTFIFYVGQTADYQRQIYLTECTDPLALSPKRQLSFTTPVQVKFNGAPPNEQSEIDRGGMATKPIDQLIDPQVLKVGDEYYMVLKREAWVSQDKDIKSLNATLMIYKTKDSSLKSWDFVYEFDNFKIPFNTGDYDYVSAEGPCLAYINGVYYLYMDIFDTTESATINGNDYKGTHIFKSNDLTKRDSWEFVGKLNADDQFGYKNLRHGSICKVNDAKSASTIQTLYNGLVDVPVIEKSYTGSEQYCVDYSTLFHLRPIGSAFYEPVEGTWKATEKGEYTCTIKLKSDTMKWADGYADSSRTITWKIK